MPVLIQVCAVVVTLAMVVIAFATMRATRRLEVAGQEFSRTAEVVRESVRKAEGVAREVQELAVALKSIAPPVRHAADQFGALAERVAEVSNAMLDEVESPIRTTLAVLTGVKTGTRSLFGALARRAHGQHRNGGGDHG
jgi:uncharacterized protein YoxC